MQANDYSWLSVIQFQLWLAYFQDFLSQMETPDKVIKDAFIKQRRKSFFFDKQK